MGSSLNVPPASVSHDPAHKSSATTQNQRIPWHQQFRRSQIVQSLEAVQDLIAVSLCVGLFCVMALQLKAIFASLLTTPQFHCYYGGYPVYPHPG